MCVCVCVLASLCECVHVCAQGRVWSGCRPMSPDGLPIVGRLPHTANVHVNCGHGMMGWTLCGATATMIVDVLSRPPTAPPDSVAEAACSPERFLWLWGLNSARLIRSPR